MHELIRESLRLHPNSRYTYVYTLGRRLAVDTVLYCSSPISVCDVRGQNIMAPTAALVSAINVYVPRNDKEAFLHCSFARNKCSLLFYATKQVN